MRNSENQGKSGVSLFTVAAIALAISGAALLMIPASATSEGPSFSVTAAAGTPGYFPAEYVNQGAENQPLPEQF